MQGIEDKLKFAPQKHADESGIRIAGKTQWLHTLSNEKFVHYRASEKRGDVPRDLTGVVTHDHFVSYYSQMKHVKHSLCNAHHLRELKAVEEIDKEPWARHMARLLCLGNNAKKTAGQPTKEWLARFRKLYDYIVDQGLQYHEKLGVLNKPKRGRIKRRPGHNLLLRLQRRADDTLRFLHDPNVPFTNNLAERDLRMIKVKQKISGSFRTARGAQQFLAIKSYIATAKKNGLSVIDALIAAFKQNPFQFDST